MPAAAAPQAWSPVPEKHHRLVPMLQQPRCLTMKGDRNLGTKRSTFKHDHTISKITACNLL
jgi:hypothetical protein